MDSDDIELLTLDGESAAEEVDAPEQVEEEAVHVPVEDLGIGIVNALGDMVGGMVGLQQSTRESLKRGVQIVKDKVSKSDDQEEAQDVVAEDEDLPTGNILKNQ
jgi:hypothetical protein